MMAVRTKKAILDRGFPLRRNTQIAFRAGNLTEQGRRLTPGGIVANHGDVIRQRPKCGEIAHDIAGTADGGVFARNADHRHRRFRGNPAHVTINEAVDHGVTDAQYTPPGKRGQKRH
jgi:hypothetical protein